MFTPTSIAETLKNTSAQRFEDISSQRNLTAGLRIKENKEVYEGEVTELTPEETENQVDSWQPVFPAALILSLR